MIIKPVICYKDFLNLNILIGKAQNKEGIRKLWVRINIGRREMGIGKKYIIWPLC